MSIYLERFEKKTVEIAGVYTIKETTETNIKLKVPELAALFLKKEFKSLDWFREHFISVSLNSQHYPISTNVISIGSINANIVHPRETFYSAIIDHAEAILVCHNHPSGNVTPSQNDVNITLKLVEAGRIIGIELLDHIIIGGTTAESKYYSMKENSLI